MNFEDPGTDAGRLWWWAVMRTERDRRLAVKSARPITPPNLRRLLMRRMGRIGDQPAARKNTDARISLLSGAGKGREMMNQEFSDFFNKATGGQTNYPYQETFATTGMIPHLLRAPTGAGKTATAILGWIFRRTTHPKQTPRRLVYCLPMRVLVEQSKHEAEKWVENLELDIPVHVLMGGVDTEDWHLQPERPTIVIGTQDMLLSRALNRGYAASRFHWPIDFALLNNDCLWVFDEPQLMGAGVSTSAQLAGLRQALSVQSDCPSVWMSATLEPEWLDTIDFRAKFTGDPLELADADYHPQLPLHKRMTAAKELHKLDVDWTEPKSVADAILNRLHKPGTQTLVIVNTVDRAKNIYGELLKLRKKSTTPELLLIHSRFRPAEREQLNEALQREPTGNRIIVATQVVEAGVDISSRTLITEVAPWASVVQRIGRCNRTGNDGNADDPAHVFWIDLPEKLALPYSDGDLDFARAQLSKLEGKDVSPKALNDFKRVENITLPFEHKHVLRRRDLLDLFDTTPDLSGTDIDIQRFVRGDDPDTDVQVFWRDFTGSPGDQPSPERRELCNVPVGQFRKFIEGKDGAGAFIWDHLEDKWVKLEPKQVRPGLVILLPAPTGGYSALGWDPSSGVKVECFPPVVKKPEDAMDSDSNSTLPIALTIAQHTDNVIVELRAILKSLSLDNMLQLFEPAARWHDVGKAMQVCQNAFTSLNPTLDRAQFWAKSGKRGKLRYDRARAHFRHELASALAALQHSLSFDTAYLIAAHHGKVRLSIRSLPGEEPPENADALFALGVRSGDVLPAVDLGDGVLSLEITLDLTPMQLGGDTSWTARALDLLKEHGPFKLAYLEAILRIADVRASQKEADRAQ